MTTNSHDQDPGENEVTGQPGTFLTRPFAGFGRKVISWVDHMGAATIFFGKACIMIFRPKQIPAIIQQIYYIGAKSITIIMLVGFFTGMVLGLQSYHALVKFGAQGALGTLVALSLVRELGPVLTAIMITARAGSAMTAEIGIQRISEQIDALDTMRIDPLKFLISPRIAAAIISFPLLTALFDLIRHPWRLCLRGRAAGYKCRHLLSPRAVQRGDEGRHRRFYQGPGIRRHCYHCLLLPGLFHPHAHGQLRCQRC